MSEKQQPTKSAGSSTRVDSAHTLSAAGPENADAVRVSADVLEVAAGEIHEHSVEQIHAQAGQLAGHLRAQQKVLDHRESQLNAHAAQLEGEIRTARLMLREREQELGEEKNELVRRAKELEQQATQVAAADVAIGEDKDEYREGYRQKYWELQKQEAELNTERKRIEQERESSKKMVEAMLDEIEQKRAALDKEARLMEETIQRGANAGEMENIVAEIQTRRDQLDEAEKVLNEQLDELEQARKKLDAEREQVEARARHDRRQLAERQRRAEEELDNKKKALARKVENLDQRRAAIEQLQADVTRMHRESLEMRLATEELWAQLSGRMAPAQLTQSLGQIRSRLADHYRLANESLAQQKEELTVLGTRLDAKKKELATHRKDLQDWVHQRHAEIEQQAARLVAREQELDRQETQFKEAEREWDEERLRYQEEIRHLHSRLRHGELAPA